MAVFNEGEQSKENSLAQAVSNIGFYQLQLFLKSFNNKTEF
tara:strand:+ start:419 stop:541 length:123 start_codon:yes stop_codon:yes gene_type:complete